MLHGRKNQLRQVACCKKQRQKAGTRNKDSQDTSDETLRKVEVKAGTTETEPRAHAGSDKTHSEAGQDSQENEKGRRKCVLHDQTNPGGQSEGEKQRP